MAQKYNIKFKKGNKNKEGLFKIYVRVLTQGLEIKIPTSVQLQESQWNGSSVIKHLNKDVYNATLKKAILDIENRLIKGLEKNVPISAEYLSGKISSDAHFHDFILPHIKQVELKSTGTARVLKVVLKKMPNIPLSRINDNYLLDLEKKLRIEGLDGNTINTQMKRAKYMLKQAVTKGILDESAIKHYKAPPYVQKIPEYLTIEEIDNFKKVVDSVLVESKKTSGYYFLLSCYTGFRLSDLKRFDSSFINNETILIRASKNNKIVSIPMYDRLKEVVSYCLQHPLRITEQHFRLFVKEIAKDIGITRNIKVHTGRHTFAMLLINKGFSIDEVAELLGDTPEVARVYARITNTHLSRKFDNLKF